MGMGWLGRLMGERPDEQLAVYQAVIARAREPHWYLEGQVPDTMDGRFDMVAAVLATVLLRLERESAGAGPGARLAERFVEDMDGQLREQGVGDIVVGKHIGRMMAMLGGRLGAYRDGWAAGEIGPALVRNLYRGVDPGAGAVAHTAARLDRLREGLAALPIDTVLAGKLP
jgi:cytochrome b pre-mRNA-processing protein 3